MYLDDLLQKKWNSIKKDRSGVYYGQVKHISDNVYLNELCSPIDMQYYEKLEQQLGIKLLPELKEFYKSYNGCRLFHSSISIYGMPTSESRPFDFFLNNYNHHAELIKNNCNDDDIVFFGGVGDNFIYYRQSEIKSPKIYLSKLGSVNVNKEFSSIKELMNYYINALSYEYDENGFKKHQGKEKWMKGAPIIQNSWNGDIDWKIPTEEQERIKKKENNGQNL